jgi:NADPH:quinone reductase-like Zn-dependent oxidoreductase
MVLHSKAPGFDVVHAGTLSRARFGFGLGACLAHPSVALRCSESGSAGLRVRSSRFVRVATSKKLNDLTVPCVILSSLRLRWRSFSARRPTARRDGRPTRAGGRRFAGLSVEPDYPGLEALAGLVDSGQLRVHLQTTLPLAEAAKAHQLFESGRTTGKIALTI